jgi:hypothetical protein
MSPVRFLQSVIAGIALCAAVQAQSPVVVYDSSSIYSGKFNESLNEYGDEIILFGSAHFVTQLQFEYVGNFVPQGDEKARVRFYANTGPAWMGNHDYITPAATPLWETLIPISVGFNTATITVPYIDVPLRFTWTIQFFGVTMTSTDNAGLLFYGKPILGSSFNDYWEQTASGWLPERYADITNNFAAKIMAVSAPPALPVLNVSAAGGNLVVHWPAVNNGMFLESRPAQGGNWTPVYPLALRVGDVFQTSIPIGSDSRIFRLNSMPQPPISIIRVADGLHLRWSAAVGGQKLQMKTSITDATWTDLATPTRPVSDYYEAVVVNSGGAAFFRLARTF